MKSAFVSALGLLSCAAAVPLQDKRSTSLTLDVQRRNPFEAADLAKRGGQISQVQQVSWGGQWYAPAKAGGQDVTLLLDTGSADL